MTYTGNEMAMIALLVFVLCGMIYGTIINIQRERSRIKAIIYISSHDIVRIISMNIEFSRKKPAHYNSVDDYLQTIFDKSTEEIISVCGIYSNTKYARKCIMNVIDMNMDRIMVAVNSVNNKTNPNHIRHDNVIPMRAVRE